jgi:hypothetical protein
MGEVSHMKARKPPGKARPSAADWQPINDRRAAWVRRYYSNLLIELIGRVYDGECHLTEEDARAIARILLKDADKGRDIEAAKAAGVTHEQEK